MFSCAVITWMAAPRRDAEDARRVAEHIGIPFYVWDFEDEYKKRVVEYMVDGYRAGITPNPDVMCNREIKFGLFFEKALSMGADYVATGHYVRLKREGRKLKIFRYRRDDENKDQSYFLWTLSAGTAAALPVSGRRLCEAQRSRYRAESETADGG